MSTVTVLLPQLHLYSFSVTCSPDETVESVLERLARILHAPCTSVRLEYREEGIPRDQTITQAIANTDSNVFALYMSEPFSGSLPPVERRVPEMYSGSFVVQGFPHVLHYTIRAPKTLAGLFLDLSTDLRVPVQDFKLFHLCYRLLPSMTAGPSVYDHTQPFTVRVGETYTESKYFEDHLVGLKLRTDPNAVKFTLDGLETPIYALPDELIIDVLKRYSFIQGVDINEVECYADNSVDHLSGVAETHKKSAHLGILIRGLPFKSSVHTQPAPIPTDEPDQTNEPPQPTPTVEPNPAPLPNQAPPQTQANQPTQTNETNIELEPRPLKLILELAPDISLEINQNDHFHVIPGGIRLSSALAQRLTDFSLNLANTGRTRVIRISWRDISQHMERGFVELRRILDGLEIRHIVMLFFCGVAVSMSIQKRGLRATLLHAIILGVVLACFDGLMGLVGFDYKDFILKNYKKMVFIKPLYPEGTPEEISEMVDESLLEQNLSTDAITETMQRRQGGWDLIKLFVLSFAMPELYRTWQHQQVKPKSVVYQAVDIAKARREARLRELEEPDKEVKETSNND